jgi:hypothetical protein
MRRQLTGGSARLWRAAHGKPRATPQVCENGKHDQTRNTTDAGKDDESRKTHRCRDAIDVSIV